jgi:hypothetical protein
MSEGGKTKSVVLERPLDRTEKAGENKETIYGSLF